MELTFGNWSNLARGLVLSRVYGKRKNSSLPRTDACSGENMGYVEDRSLFWTRQVQASFGSQYTVFGVGAASRGVKKTDPISPVVLGAVSQGIKHQCSTSTQH